MELQKTASLQSRVVASVALVFLVIFIVIYLVFRQANQNALYTVEKEKAHLIADTVSPLLAVDLYLGLDGKTDSLIRQLSSNPNILSIKLTEGETVIVDTRKKELGCHDTEECFNVRKSLNHPVTGKPFASLHLVYSSAHFNQLTYRYNIIIIAVLGGLALLSILFSFFLHRSFMPLKAIAAAAHRFEPGKPLPLPACERRDEIGQIADALREMNGRITDYAKQQEDTAHYLEEEVSKKTAQLQHQLYIDSLTGLPNRTKLMVDIDGNHAGPLLLINIDDFKQINDFYGHIAGDHVLIKLAGALARLCPEMKLYKLSADEYALLHTETLSRSDIEARVVSVISDIEAMIIVYMEAELGIRVTAGVALGLEKGMEKADIALKAARSQHKSFLIYDESLNMEHQYEQNMQWLRRLKSAIDENRIVPYYQPIYDNETDSVQRYECLIRLLEKDGNVLQPDRFLPVSKKARLYERLTEIMIESCCRHFAARTESFSVNLSVDDILDEPTVLFIQEQIIKHGVGQRIIFEILESEGIENYQEVSAFIKKMKQLGCRFAIDDFGSGYSNFEHLLHLDIDYIKIDGSLIRNLDSDVNSLLIVEAIVNIAQKRELACIAEYVHNRTVMELVKRLGIRYAQGFYLGEPRPEVLEETSRAIT
ncbi:MAG: EAL domain-containing protein [Campylobacterales bacterium]